MFKTKMNIFNAHQRRRICTFREGCRSSKSHQNTNTQTFPGAYAQHKDNKIFIKNIISNCIYTMLLCLTEMIYSEVECFP